MMAHNNNNNNNNNRKSARQLLRLTRIFRVFRVLGSIPRVDFILRSLYLSSLSLVNIVALFLVFLYVFSVIAMNLFSGVRVGWLGYMDGKYGNFNSFSNSFVTLFRCATGENFNGILHELGTAPPYCSPSAGNCGSVVTSSLFFVVFIFFSAYIILNLITSVMLEAYEEAGASSVGDSELPPNHVRLTPHLLRRFTEEWGKRDPEGSNLLSREDLVHLICALPAPLGLANGVEEAEIKRRWAQNTPASSFPRSSADDNDDDDAKLLLPERAKAQLIELKQCARQIIAKSSLVPYTRPITSPTTASSVKQQQHDEKATTNPFPAAYHPPPTPSSSWNKVLSFVISQSQLSGRGSSSNGRALTSSVPSGGGPMAIHSPLAQQKYHFQAVLFALLERSNGSQTMAVGLEGALCTTELPERAASVARKIVRIWRRRKAAQKVSSQRDL